MRNVIRHTDTGLYYGKGGKWIASPQQALAFLDEVRARDFCIYRRLTTVTVIAVPDNESPEGAHALLAQAPPVVHQLEPETEQMKPKVAQNAPTPSPVKQPPVTANGAPAGPRANKPALTARVESRMTKKKTPQKVATPRAKADQPPAAEQLLTTVEVKIDVGFGNTLFIRGQGDGLSWDQGVPLRCLDSSTWVYSTTEAKDKLVFKLLLNDQRWSQGDNHIAPAGVKTEVSPAF